MEKPKKKIILTLIGIILIAAVITAGVLLKWKIFSDSSSEIYYISGIIDAEGTIHFIKEDGAVVSVTGNAAAGYTASEGSCILILDDDGTLWQTDSESEGKTILAERVTSLERPSEYGFVFTKEGDEQLDPDYDTIIRAVVDDYEENISISMVEDLMEENEISQTLENALDVYEAVVGAEYEAPFLDIVCRYSFEGEKIIELGTGNYRKAADSDQILYEEEGTVCVLEEGMSEKQITGFYDKNAEIYLAYISDDVNYCVWIVRQDHEISIYISHEGDVEKVDSYEVDDKEEAYENIASNVIYNMNYQVYEIEEKNAVIITNAQEGTIYRKQGRKETEVITLDEDISYFRMFRSADGLYLEAEMDESGYNLYYLGMNTEVIKVLSDVQQVIDVQEDLVYYLNDKNMLYQAKLKAGVMTGEAELDSEVKSGYVSEDGQIIYYIKNYDDEEESGMLCYAEAGKKSEVITEGVCDTAMDISADGKTVFYLTDLEEPAAYKKMGRLHKYVIGEGDFPVADDVTNTYIINRKEAIDPDGFVYMQHTKTEEDDIFQDYFYFDGTQGKWLFGNVIY